MAYIEFKNIDKFYGDNHVLKGINLEIHKGDFVTLLARPDVERVPCSAASQDWSRSQANRYCWTGKILQTKILKTVISEWCSSSTACSRI